MVLHSVSYKLALLFGVVPSWTQNIVETHQNHRGPADHAWPQRYRTEPIDQEQSACRVGANQSGPPPTLPAAPADARGFSLHCGRPAAFIGLEGLCTCATPATSWAIAWSNCGEPPAHADSIRYPRCSRQTCPHGGLRDRARCRRGTCVPPIRIEVARTGAEVPCVSG
jgi:hypothetical protein